MPNKFVLKPIGLTGNTHANLNGRSSTPQFFRECNPIDGIRMWELLDNGGSIGLTKTPAAFIGEVISDITGIRNKAVFNKNAGNSLFAGTTNHGEFVAHFHLKYAAVRKAHSSKVIHNLIGKLNRNLRAIGAICGGSVNLSTMSSRGARINMEAHESLRSLFDAPLNAIKEIIARIVAVLFTSKNHLETICLELILAGRYDFPGKIGFAFAIALRAGIRSTVTSIKSDYANISRRTIGIGRNTIRRIGALQRLLNRLGLNSISVPICIINGCVLGVHRAIYDGE